ncbi:MAG: hypothetical protein M1419_07155 [Bacteroidetes bacterium]|nr:hypothetical protein [Bacteroidota bacterium]
MKKFVILLLSISLILCSCSHVENVTIKADPEKIITKTVIKEITPPLKFARGKYEDKRADFSYLAKWSEGMNTWTLYEETPIEDVIFDGLRTLFMHSGLAWVNKDSSEIIINVTLLGVVAIRTPKIFSEEIISSIQIKLDFVSSASGKQIYSNIYNGTNEDYGFIIMSDVEKSINESLINCINSIGLDKGLKENLSNIKI